MEQSRKQRQARRRRNCARQITSPGLRGIQTQVVLRCATSNELNSMSWLRAHYGGNQQGYNRLSFEDPSCRVLIIRHKCHLILAHEVSNLRCHLLFSAVHEFSNSICACWSNSTKNEFAGNK
jgi:hypothetical protein